MPAASATAPAAIAGATRGTTARFTTGDTSESRPNSRRITGSVAACAARETPSDSASQPRSRPGRAPASRFVSPVPQAMRPAVASTERRKPASSTYPGSTSSRPATAQPSAAVARLGRPSSRASRTSPAIAAARTTDGDGPTNATYATIATLVSTVRRRRPIPPTSAPMLVATIAMFQPEIATMWLTPAVVKSAASWRSTRSRSPMRMPAARPASGSGRVRVRPVAALRRWSSSQRPKPGGGGRSSRALARIEPAAPIRAR